LSVTVAGLGLIFFAICPGRPLSGFVVVRCSGQLDRLLGSSFRVLYSTAAFPIRPVSSSPLVPLDVRDFHSVLARG
jgi:hypothetical protein